MSVEIILIMHERDALKVSYLFHLHLNLPFSLWRLTTRRDENFTILIPALHREKFNYRQFLKENTLT